MTDDTEERKGFVKIFCPKCKDHPGWGPRRTVGGFYDQECDCDCHEPGVKIVATRLYDKKVMS